MEIGPTASHHKDKTRRINALSENDRLNFFLLLLIPFASEASAQALFRRRRKRRWRCSFKFWSRLFLHSDLQWRSSRDTGVLGSLNQLLRAGVANGHGFRSSALQCYLTNLPIELLTRAVVEAQVVASWTTIPNDLGLILKWEYGL